MVYKHKSLRMALVAAGLTFGVVQSASAVILADGCYDIKINPNPGTYTPPVGTGSPLMTTVPGSNGPAGSWNSNFAFGGTRPSASAQGMFDTGPITVNGRTTGVADGKAGVIGITVTGGTFSVSSFQVDPIFLTAGGTFVQYANSTAAMTGTIDQTTGAMTFTPTGRLGAVSGFPVLVDESWDIDDFTTPGKTTWTPFTTGTANSVNTGTAAPTTATGHVLVSNGSGGANGVLVSGGRCGSVWGGFNGCGYYETWNITVFTKSCPVVLVNPAVASTSPANAATNVGTTTPSYDVTFDQAMDVTSGSAGDITIDHGVTVGAPTVAGNTFRYPISGLVASTVYTVTFHAGPKSSGGVALTIPANMTFTTGTSTGQTAVAPMPASGSAGGGCVVSTVGAIIPDPTLAGLLMAALGYLGWKRKQRINAFKN
jgi:hypothetical protein